MHRKFTKIELGVPLAKDQVTIVIPVKNEELAISKVIDELAQEGYRNILVVDGYSADKTQQILQTKKKRQIYPAAWQRQNRRHKNSHRERHHTLHANPRQRLHLPSQRHPAPSEPLHQL